MAILTAPVQLQHLAPEAAWQAVREGRAWLIDVRTTAEWRWVGRVPQSLHVPWSDGEPLAIVPHFADRLQAALAARGRQGEALVFLCRSGVRSVRAGEAAAAAGLGTVFNVLEGFEGQLDERRQRGSADGWRHRGLPWLQD
jgi:rhodanese-related sulfurtransferase